MGAEETAVAYGRAIDAVRAAMMADDGEGARAARDTLLEVTDAHELREVVGAVAYLAGVLIPRHVRRGAPVPHVLERAQVEVWWRTS